MLLPHHFFLSIIDCFNVFSYNTVHTFIQSRNLGCRIFNTEMYSFVIKIAILVNKSVLDDMVKPAIGFNITNVLKFFVEADPINNSVITNKNFFLFKLLYFSYNNHYQS